MAGQRRSFRSNALHQVTIAAHGVNVEIENIEPRPVVSGAQPFPGDGNSHAVAASLAQRTRGGFYARSEVRFRMAGSPAV